MDNRAGSFTFEVIDGEIYLTDYRLNRGWQVWNSYYDWDGSLVTELHQRRGGLVAVRAWLDGDGHLHVETL